MSNEQLKNLAMIDIAETLLTEKKEPILIYDLLDEVAEIKGINKEDADALTSLYMDITLSAKFVFVGDDKWTLKEGNLDYWDKDGYAFITVEEDDEPVDDDFDFAEFELADDISSNDDSDEDDLDLDEEAKEEAKYIDEELPINSTDDDDIEDLDFDGLDEDDYNEIMDDYEDMYED